MPPGRDGAEIVRTAPVLSGLYRFTQERYLEGRQAKFQVIVSDNRPLLSVSQGSHFSEEGFLPKPRVREACAIWYLSSQKPLAFGRFFFETSFLRSWLPEGPA
jgi:hypothetical protein